MEREYLGTNAIGSGPHRLARFDTTGVLLERNPNYQGRYEPAKEGFDPIRHPARLATANQSLPLTSNVEVFFVEDGVSRMASAMDFLDTVRVPADQLSRVVEEAQLKAPYNQSHTHEVVPEFGFVHLDFNMRSPRIGQNDDPAQDDRHKELRCALLGLDSWDRRNQLFFAGVGVPFKGLVPPSVSSDPIDLVPNNNALGDYLPVLTYGALAGIRGRQEFEYWRSLVADQGYPADRLEFRSYPSIGALIEGLQRNEIDLYMLGWSMDYPDPLNNYQLFYGPNGLPGANFSGFSNDSYDREFANARDARSERERLRAFAAMERVLAEQCVTLSGLMRSSVFLMNKRYLVKPDNGPINGVITRFVKAGE